MDALRTFYLDSMALSACICLVFEVQIRIVHFDRVVGVAITWILIQRHEWVCASLCVDPFKKRSRFRPGHIVVCCDWSDLLRSSFIMCKRTQSFGIGLSALDVKCL